MNNDPPAESGIWIAIRRKAEPGYDLCCDFCYRPIHDQHIFNERTTGKPIKVCQNCVTQMLDARLILIGRGD